MAANPNPSRITEPMWWLWEQFKAAEPTAEFGGIYAAKPGYHNTRNGNDPSNYSVAQYALDRQGPADKAAAIDLTFPDAQSGRYATIIKYAARLLKSGQDPHDERGNYLREFYGQADQDQSVEGWDYQALTTSTSDTSHLWHIHISVMRAYVDDRRMARAVLSILAGQTVEAWRAAEAGTVTTPTSRGDTVAFLDDPNARVMAYRMHDLAMMEETVTTPQGEKVPNRAVTALKQIAADVAAVKAAAAEDQTRDAGMLAAINALAAGGGVDAAPIVAAVREEAARTRTLVEQLQVALAAKEDELRQVLAAAARAEADKLGG